MSHMQTAEAKQPAPSGIPLRYRSDQTEPKLKEKHPELPGRLQLVADRFAEFLGTPLTAEAYGFINGGRAMGKGVRLGLLRPEASTFVLTVQFGDTGGCIVSLEVTMSKTTVGEVDDSIKSAASKLDMVDSLFDLPDGATPLTRRDNGGQHPSIDQRLANALASPQVPRPVPVRPTRDVHEPSPKEERMLNIDWKSPQKATAAERALVLAAWLFNGNSFNDANLHSALPKHFDGFGVIADVETAIEKAVNEKWFEVPATGKLHVTQKGLAHAESLLISGRVPSYGGPPSKPAVKATGPTLVERQNVRPLPSTLRAEGLPKVARLLGYLRHLFPAGVTLEQFSGGLARDLGDYFPDIKSAKININSAVSPGGYLTWADGKLVLTRKDPKNGLKYAEAVLGGAANAASEEKPSATAAKTPKKRGRPPGTNEKKADTSKKKATKPATPSAPKKKPRPYKKVEAELAKARDTLRKHRMRHKQVRAELEARKLEAEKLEHDIPVLEAAIERLGAELTESAKQTE